MLHTSNLLSVRIMNIYNNVYPNHQALSPFSGNFNFTIISFILFIIYMMRLLSTKLEDSSSRLYGYAQSTETQLNIGSRIHLKSIKAIQLVIHDTPYTLNRK